MWALLLGGFRIWDSGSQQELRHHRTRLYIITILKSSSTSSHALTNKYTFMYRRLIPPAAQRSNESKQTCATILLSPQSSLKLQVSSVS